jgi:hypothetical protein
MSTITDKIERLNTRDCTHGFAEPNSPTMIDLMHPVTKRSLCYGETLDQIRVRYPTAEIIEVAQWAAQKGATQDVPVTWEETTEEKYDEMLNVLPPAFWEQGLFLVGEPWDHHAITGRPRFAAYRELHGKYFAASRPMTVKEARTIVERDPAEVAADIVARNQDMLADAITNTAALNH